jgi:hypothetical protein
MSSAHGAGQMLVPVLLGLPVAGSYQSLGDTVLRRGWVNMDLGWSLVLIASGAITLVTAL